MNAIEQDGCGNSGMWKLEMTVLNPTSRVYVM